MFSAMTTPLEEVRLFISVPSNRDWKGPFGSSLACLTSHLSSKGILGHNLTNYFLRAWGQASCLSIARQKFIDEMIAGNYTHWLSLDDDMTFPMNIVDCLIAHNKDVVSVNARHKSPNEIKGSLHSLDGQMLLSAGKTGLEEIQSMGGAIFLAKIDAFKHIPKPHFQVLWLPDREDYLSEDMHFALLLWHNKIKMFCDHDTSQYIGHVGDVEYRWQQLDGNKQ